jgi:uncharacterized protein with von Willebrand factor type A (vWA) domain
LAPPEPGPEKGSQILPGFGNGSAPDEEGEQKTFSGASAVERLRKVDFSQMPQTDLAELERISLRLLRRMSYRVARRLRARRRPDSIDLQEFNRRHAAALLSRRTVFIILSDGWDTGAPEELTAELRKIRRRVEKLIWLNPLLGLNDYQPVTRGISAALPFIDIFAPAHNLQSLLDLEEHLRPGRYSLGTHV